MVYDGYSRHELARQRQDDLVHEGRRARRVPAASTGGGADERARERPSVARELFEALRRARPRRAELGIAR